MKHPVLEALQCMPRAIWQTAPLLRQGKTMDDLEQDLRERADETRPDLLLSGLASPHSDSPPTSPRHRADGESAPEQAATPRLPGLPMRKTESEPVRPPAPISSPASPAIALPVRMPPPPPSTPLAAAAAGAASWGTPRPPEAAGSGGGVLPPAAAELAAEGAPAVAEEAAAAAGGAPPPTSPVAAGPAAAAARQTLAGGEKIFGGRSQPISPLATVTSSREQRAAALGDERAAAQAAGGAEGGQPTGGQAEAAQAEGGPLALATEDFDAEHEGLQKTIRRTLEVSLQFLQQSNEEAYALLAMLLCGGGRFLRGGSAKSAKWMGGSAKSAEDRGRSLPGTSREPPS